jgi:predicted permease
LAGISSFIFQLPFQLLFLECHALEQEYLVRSSLDTSKIGAKPDEEEGHFVEETGHLSENQTESKVASEEVEETTVKAADEVVVPLMMWTQFARRGDVWRRILIRIFHNPVLWGIAVGFLLSLSTLGPRFLKPSSDEFVPGLGWIFRTCEWFGACVSPVSLFAMGVWMEDQGKKLFQIPLYSAFLFMFSKLFVVPLIMVGLAKALDLGDEAGRAAVLIAALPISMASFSLAGHYEIGHATLSANVVLGTALMLPTILIWDIVMDTLDLFPSVVDKLINTIV